MGARLTSPETSSNASYRPRDLATRSEDQIADELGREAGVKEETVHAILYDNPRRFLAFVPRVH